LRSREADTSSDLAVPAEVHLGCYQIIICRPTKQVKQLSRDQIGQAVLDIREAWKRESLDVERLYKVAVLAHQYRADQYECLPGCCGPWGEIEPVMPPGPGAVLTVNQLYQARMRAVRIPLPSDLAEGARSSRESCFVRGEAGSTGLVNHGRQLLRLVVRHSPRDPDEVRPPR
jgi:hypothetical protein